MYDDFFEVNIKDALYASEKYKLKKECRIHAHKSGWRKRSHLPKHCWLTRFPAPNRG